MAELINIDSDFTSIHLNDENEGRQAFFDMIMETLENHHSKMYFKDFVNHKAGFLKNEIDVKLFVNNLLL